MARKKNSSPRSKPGPARRRPSPRTPKPLPLATETYWQAIRRPVYALVFLLPMMALYEFGVVLWGQRAAKLILTSAHKPYNREVLRNFADDFIRLFFSRLTDALGWSGLFLCGSVIILTLLAWQILSRRSWSVKLDHVVGMTGESILYASVLMLPYVIVNFHPVRNSWGPSTARLMHLFFSLGAGVYEEFIFRVILMGILSFILVRAAQIQPLPASFAAALGAALVFAAVHHFGPGADPFRWTLFATRTVFGLAFGAVFIARGFAVAAGTHAFYNILVGMADF